MNKKWFLWLVLMAFMVLSVSGCKQKVQEEIIPEAESSVYELTLVEESSKQEASEEPEESQVEENSEEVSEEVTESATVGYVSPDEYEDFNADTIPAFAGYTYAVIHDNIPYFTDEEIAEALEGAYEDYSLFEKKDNMWIVVTAFQKDSDT